METGLDSFFRNGKLVMAAATVAAGVGIAHPSYAADAVATTCMATIGTPHEVTVGTKAPIILQKLAASSLLKEGETRNPRAGRCDQVKDFTRLSVEHQQLVKDLYDKWRQDFSQLPEDNIVLAMSGVIKILARLPAVDEYLHDITTANEQYKNDPRGLLAELKKLPREPAILGYFGVIAQKLGVSTDDLVTATPSLKPMYAKAKALTKTTEIVTQMVAGMQQIAAESDARLASANTQLATSNDQVKLSEQYVTALRMAAQGR